MSRYAFLRKTKNLLKNWIKGLKKSKINKKHAKITLIIILGCFFCGQVLSLNNESYRQDYQLGKPKVFDQAEIKDIKIKLAVSGDISESNIAFSEIISEESQRDNVEKGLYELVGDYPIKEMIPEIRKYDRETAAFIIGIAKKESNWGKRSPSKNGFDCYNYWGYKGAGSRGIAMGHGCFGSPEEGVQMVGNRISTLLDQNLNTPAKLIVWKCGRSCAGHDPASVTKWISDVNLYYNKVKSIHSEKTISYNFQNK